MNAFLQENSKKQVLDSATQSMIHDLAKKTADPQAVLHNIGDFIKNNPEQQPHLAQCLASPMERQRLVRTLGNSPYLANVLRRWPTCLPVPGEEPQALLSKNWASENKILLDTLLEAHTWEEAARILRIHKHRSFFHIGSRDLSGEATLTEVIQAISNLAEGCLEAGYQWLNRQLSARYGRPMVYTEEGKKTVARFVILGMGKLGARELNFSSDVDLIYLFDAGHGEVEDSCTLSLKAYFNRLGRDLIRLLGEPTAEGQVFRIDLRLRPEGESGELSLSRDSAELYYESWGQTWERSAMIKARPVAGDLAWGDDFLKELQPFIFRRYLDFGALDAIREMKRKIDRKMTMAEDYYHNIKLGYGGIREIEFFVQSHQLIHGGKNPVLRHRETLLTLDHLCQAGWLTQETSHLLAEAYRFLRTLEHRLQIKHDQQLHSIPEDQKAFERLSKRMGMAKDETLRTHLRKVRDSVHTIYEALFLDAEKKNEASYNPHIETLLTCEAGEEKSLDQLKKAGFNDPEKAGTLMRILREGPKRLGLTESMRCWYRRIAAPLLQEILRAPDPDMAIHHADNFLASLGHRISYLALLLENPPILTLLVRLFGTSVLLSRFFMKHPELMDRLVTQDFLQHDQNRDALSHELTTLLKGADEKEERFNIIRAFKNSETLRIGVRDLSHMAELTEVMSGLSALADVILTRILEDAFEELTERYGSPNTPFVILAMGKLGGRELNYASDLDLIFLHGSQGEAPWTDGSNAIANSLFFTRLGQRVITAMTTLTRSGKLYELDMRLRPSGNSGTLVTSAEAFLRYQKEEAWVWEHQALTRARVVAGDSAFAKDLHQEIRTIIQQTREIELLRQDVVQMRLRIFNEKKPDKDWIDIKQSRGGIVDIEFLAQFLILAYADKNPDIIQNNTARALRACQKAGLLHTSVHATLEKAYGFFRLVENRLRLLHGCSENGIGPSPIVREQLRRLCDLPENDDIISILEAHFQAVFPIIQEVLEGIQPEK